MSPSDNTMDMKNPWLSRAAFLPFIMVGMLVVFNGGLVSGIFQTEKYIWISYFGLGIMMTAMIAHTATKAICWQMQQTRQQPTLVPARGYALEREQAAPTAVEMRYTTSESDRPPL